MNELIEMLRKFNAERDWEQFHSPKNLVMALGVEIAEITEHFQWLTQEQSRNLKSEKLDLVKDEIADIMIFLTLLADKFGIDPIKAAKEKISVNARRYPVALARGKADKYTDLT